MLFVRMAIRAALAYSIGAPASVPTRSHPVSRRPGRVMVLG
jgi:hypothetical protein